MHVSLILLYRLHLPFMHLLKIEYCQKYPYAENQIQFTL
ncbi:hypothetical protein F7D09_1899 [Bifidobacterium leontopitheci]|uniref:Uncharacterized protein n=1 Tax=Bifidobacterium leontopitheci TaxID=2650774 RepID=A0A6I1GD77_9BIFI|nr:hypothetical protein F7D09_1899 [Bifidobacterium leontopitheci]